MKAPLILVVSKKMDKNKKRQEQGVIRMGKIARETLGLVHDKSVELWPDGDIYERTNRSRVLAINEAYKEDLKELKVKINNSQMTEEDYAKVGFVTAATFSYLCKNAEMGNKIWLADSLTDLVIGSDPEFVITDKNNHIIYPPIPHEAALGNDGNLVEVRAHPAITSAEHVKNIHNVFKKSPNTKEIKGYEWKAGCYIMAINGEGTERGFAVGGHIHLGTPAKLAKTFEDGDPNAYKRYVILSVLKKILDEYVAIPLMFIEGIQNSTARRKYYGRLTDVRVDHGRLEYRTPGGDWLAHPKLAEAVLDATKAVAHSFFKIMEESDNKVSMALEQRVFDKLQHDRLNTVDFLFGVSNTIEWERDSEIAREMRAIMPSKVLGKMLEISEPKPTKRLLEEIHDRYRHLPVYAEYERNVELFNEIASLPDKVLASMDRSLKDPWLEGSDFII